MACYMGCRGCCAKLRWFLFVLAALAAVACLVAGLIKTVPALIVLVKCATQDNAIAASKTCWVDFWNSSAIWFILSCIGLGCLLIALLSCCCFICAKSPTAGKRDQQQFIQGQMDNPYDTAAQGDQYYNPPAAVAKV